MAAGWIVPVSTIFILQTTLSFQSRLIPILFPALAATYGWQAGMVGYLSAANILGALLILIAGSGFIRYLGGVRALQYGLLLGGAGLALFYSPYLAIALLACALTGFGQGFASPVGSEVLQRFCPPNRRNLLFSVKQAGVPLGGVIAGLGIAPLIDYAGWRPALLFSIALVLVAVGLTWPWRNRIDKPGRRGTTGDDEGSLMQRITRLVSAPLRSLGSDPELPKLAIAGALLSATQSCWFTFTAIYFVTDLGYSLGMAGVVFALMQATGVVGRICLGWLADRLGQPLVILLLCAVVGTACSLLLYLSDASWPLSTLLLVSALSGLSVSSWNGVHIAEIARCTPPALVAESAAGSAILVNCTNAIAPMMFGVLATLKGSLAPSWLIPAVFSLLASLVVIRAMRRPAA